MTRPGGPPAAVVTRDESPDEGRLGAALRALGRPVLHWPVTALEPPDDPTALRAAAAEPHRWGWVAVTSRRGVAALAQALQEAERSWPSEWRVAVVGAKTAEAVEAVGGRVHLVAEGSGEALARALRDHLADRRGSGTEASARILVPTTPRAADTLPDTLREAGHPVDRIEAYRTELAELDVEACREVIEAGGVGVVTFTSPSAVAGLADALPDALLERLRHDAPAVVIGPTTGAAAEEGGWRIRTADTPSLEAVAETAAALLARP